MFPALRAVSLAWHGSYPGPSINDQCLLVPLAPNEDVNIEILQIRRIPIEVRRLQMRVVQPARDICRNSLLLQPHMEGV